MRASGSSTSSARSDRQVSRRGAPGLGGVGDARDDDIRAEGVHHAGRLLDAARGCDGEMELGRIASHRALLFSLSSTIRTSGA
jgi:hypothetical protein